MSGRSVHEVRHVRRQTVSSGKATKGVRVRWRRKYQAALVVGSALSLMWVGSMLTQPTRDVSWIESGEYPLVRVNDDASLRIASQQPNNNEVDVYWLGIALADEVLVKKWLDQQLVDVQTLSIRLDRRRLNEFGQLQAYIYVNGTLVNAELVRAGLASEATHPSDFAAIARNIRGAQGAVRR